VIGIVRVITTLSDVNEILKNHIIILISLGLCIVFLIFLTGLALTNTIIKPVKEITSAAKAMAQADSTYGYPKGMMTKLENLEIP